MPVVFFDLDDTLIDHSGAMHTASVQFFDQVSDRVASTSADEFAKAWVQAQSRHFPRYLKGELDFQGQRRARLRDLLAEDLTDSEADTLFSHYLKGYEGAWRAYPDVVPCLDKLSGKSLRIITNGGPEQQVRKLRLTGLEHRFDDLICAGTSGRAKPDPWIFHHACERMGVHPSEAVHVGDSLRSDYRGARDAGLHGVLLVRAGAAEPDPGVTAIRSLDELPALIDRL